MAGEGGKPDEPGTADDHVKVPAFAGTGVARMQRTVIADFE